MPFGSTFGPPQTRNASWAALCEEYFAQFQSNRVLLANGREYSWVPTGFVVFMANSTMLGMFEPGRLGREVGSISTYIARLFSIR